MPVTLADLKGVPLFEGLGAAELSCALEGDIVELPVGTVVFREGDPARHFYVILEGLLQVWRDVRGQRQDQPPFTRGMTGGEVPLLLGTLHLGTGEVREPSRVLRISAEKFWQLMGSCPAVRERILRDMAHRNSMMQTLGSQREKLAALGTLAAGLAHELNNPAAAARRSAQTLSQTLDAFDVHSTRVLEKFLFKQPPTDGSFPFAPIVAIRKVDGVKLDALQRSEREDALTDWLQELGVEEPWVAASVLVQVGYTREVLEDFSRTLVESQVTNFLEWVRREVELHVAAHELDESTRRISELITALKSYAYMDRAADRGATDVHAGLESTLTMLGFKLKQKRVQVLKHFDPALPRAWAVGGMLNQVWTNLIDNAIDALSPGGTLTLSTAAEGAQVKVTVADDGSGIAPEVLPKIFDPFFTTKAQGQGTGLGLDISYRIVVDDHGGRIEVASRPGRTEFFVWLPTQPKGHS